MYIILSCRLGLSTLFVYFSTLFVYFLKYILNTSRVILKYSYHLQRNTSLPLYPPHKMALPTEKNEVLRQLPISEDRRAMQINNKSKSNTLNSQHNDNHNSSSPEKMTVIEMLLDALSLHNLTPKDMGTLISEYIHAPRVPVRE